jgi:hypothetical protein
MPLEFAMPPSESVPPVDPTPPFGLPRFQFSLWALLVVITVVAVLLGVWSIVGTAVAWIIATIAYVVLPVPLLITAIFARDEVQAFSIGALMPWISNQLIGYPVTYALSRNQSSNGPIFLSLAMIFVAAVCGVVAVVTRRWLERRGLLRR